MQQRSGKIKNKNKIRQLQAFCVVLITITLRIFACADEHPCLNLELKNPLSTICCDQSLKK